MTSITEKIRALVNDPLLGYASKEVHAEVLTEIADRIDAELAERYVALPLDADRVPIRFKDKVTVPWSDKVYEVSGFSYQENVHTGTMTIWINTHIDGEYRALCATDSCHHHSHDTWESIIEDAIGEGMARQRNNDSGNFCERANPMNNGDLVARCKALCERTKAVDA